jgi:hypothetical protein
MALEKLRNRIARIVEASPAQRVASGATVGGAGLLDPIDFSQPIGQRYGYRSVGPRTNREIPERTRQQAQVDSIAAFRTNPMARAMIGTYVAFCVGDSGLTIQCAIPEVKEVVDRFWTDPRNHFEHGQELMFQDWLIWGEQLQEVMTGPISGMVRRSPIDVGRIAQVELENGNPLWPSRVGITKDNTMGELDWFTVVEVDDYSGLRTGEVFYWPAFRTLETDVRGAPFLMPVLDWLDSYDAVLSNLIDRTALMRYISFDVTLTGADQTAIDEWIANRGGRTIPKSGTMEVHNDTVAMKPVTATTGAFEDVKTGQAVMTNMAAGAGLSRVWLAEPEDANRATSLTMAEPVRRRIGSVQKQWCAQVAEMCRFQVDQAVALGQLPAFVDLPQADGRTVTVPAAQTVDVIGPQIAAADSQMMATVFMQLGQSLQLLVQGNIMTAEAAREAARKAWTDYMGTPYRPELDAGLNQEPGAPVDQAAVDDAAQLIQDSGGSVPLVAA